MLIDARRLENGADLRCDLCIVGAGPAGIALADRLRGSKLSVLLLESGGFNLELRTQELYRGAIHGHDYFRLDACRWRMFGGSSNRWGGWCRPLEPVDFEHRDWLPHSGWPIDADALRPFHDDAARLFELPNARFDLDSWRDRLPEPSPLGDSSFEHNVFQHSPETSFGETYGQRLFADAHTTTLLHANLVSMHLQPDSQRIGLLRLATTEGRTFTVQPSVVVLAAGGIENARLLLASRDDRAAGLGNEHDLVGRFFMEHLHVPAGHMIASGKPFNNAFFHKFVFDDVRLRGVITPTVAAQQRHRLLSTSIAIESASYSFGTPFVGWPPRLTFGPVRRYRDLRHGRWKHLVEPIKRAADRAQAIPRRLHTWNAARIARRTSPSIGRAEQVYSLYFRAEQAPHWSNRVRLSDRRDRLGIPQSVLEWSVQEYDAASIRGWLDILDQDLRRNGLGWVVPPREGWERGVIGGPHHMGATRMADDPRQGVVDAHCRVHSVDNLYVAGSSVFATGGYANPTFALVTLALRLADTLRARLAKVPEMPTSKED